MGNISYVLPTRTETMSTRGGALDVHLMTTSGAIFQFDSYRFLDLLCRLNVERLVLLVNLGGFAAKVGAAGLLGMLRAMRSLVLLQLPESSGLGASRNLLVSEAGHQGCKSLCVWGQGSRPLRVRPALLRAAHETLISDDRISVTVGFRSVVPSSEDGKPRRYQRLTEHQRTGGDPIMPIDFVLTWKLKPSRYIRPIQPLSEDCWNDPKWCFQARHRASPDRSLRSVGIAHRIGREVMRIGRIRYPRRSETRMTSYVRKQNDSLHLERLSWPSKRGPLTYLPIRMAIFPLTADNRGAYAASMSRAFKNDGTAWLDLPPVCVSQ